MDAAALIDRLEASPGVIERLSGGVSHEQAVWRPTPKTWSLLEVAAHLLDEEREDFRVRLELTLRDPSIEWPPINPEGWVVDRNYAGWDLEETVAAFLAERADSLAWLRDLVEPNWGATKTHPVAGSMTAGDLLGSWVAHDLLHIRQLARIHWEYVRHLVAPHDVGYAGDI